MDLLRVCAYCSREMTDKDWPTGPRLGPTAGQTHGCCVPCRGGLDDELSAFKERLSRVSSAWSVGGNLSLPPPDEVFG